MMEHTTSETTETKRAETTTADAESCETGHDECHETVDPATRDEMLTEYKHRCQGCGRCGPGAGGLATLHVHHLTRNPDEMDEHDPENLTVLCRACHSWQHQQTSEDEVPIDLTDEDVAALLPQDIEILQLLATTGPATTGDIASALSADLTVTAVRERLWVLMGLDNQIPSRDRQLVDQDADTGAWGLAEQIEHSSRGRIPSDVQLLLQRAEDEYVRRALEQGCDRDDVMTILDMSRRSTFYKEKRARAYDFPLDAVADAGGRPAADAEDSNETSAPVTDVADQAEDRQEELTSLTPAESDDGGDAEHTGEEQRPTAESAAVETDSAVVAGDREAVRENLQDALDALAGVEDALHRE